MEDQERSQTAVPWSVRDALVGVGLVVIGTIAAFGLLSLVEGGDGSTGGTPAFAVILGLLQGYMLLVVWLVGIKRYGASWRTLRLTRAQGRLTLFLPWLVLFGSLVFGGIYATVVTVDGVDFLLPPPIPVAALGEGVLRVFNSLIIGLLGPLAEEVFFRGFLMAALVNALGPLRGVAVASAIFAVSHGAVAVMLPAFVSGLLLSWLYLRTRSIWPPFTAHAAQNLIALALAA